MKVFVLIIFFLATAAVSFSQAGLSEKQWRKMERQIKRNKPTYQDCVFNGKISAEERWKFYPFDSASKVLIISFENMPDSFMNTLPIKDGIIDFSKVTEKRELTISQVDSLTNLFYNTGYQKKWPHYAEGTACYDPINAILFYNEKGLVFEYIEICFECFGYKPSSPKLNMGIMCNQKYSLLRQFFIQVGIENGTLTKN